jgi:hypothetical protein
LKRGRNTELNRLSPTYDAVPGSSVYENGGQGTHVFAGAGRKRNMNEFPHALSIARCDHQPILPVANVPGKLKNHVAGLYMSFHVAAWIRPAIPKCRSLPAEQEIQIPSDPEFQTL